MNKYCQNDIEIDEQEKIEKPIWYFIKREFNKLVYNKIKKYVIDTAKPSGSAIYYSDNEKYFKMYNLDLIDSDGFAFELRCGFIDKNNLFFTSYNLTEQLGEPDVERGYNYNDISDICVLDDQHLYTIFEILEIEKSNHNLGEVDYNMGNVPVYKPWLYLTDNEIEKIKLYFQKTENYSVEIDSEKLGVTITSNDGKTIRMGSKVMMRLFETGDIQKEFPIK